MPNERKAGGLWCSEVLACLSPYADHELPPETVARIEAHLAECDWCLRFGTQFSEMLRELIHQLAAPEPLDENVTQRLSERLRKST